jgi:hypothetical protein
VQVVHLQATLSFGRACATTPPSVRQPVRLYLRRREVRGHIAPDGTVYGIELLNANEQLGGEDNGNLVFVNEAKGDRKEIPLKN